MKAWSRRLVSVVGVMGLAPGVVLGTAEPAGTAASLYVGLETACPLFEGEWWNTKEVRDVPVRAACALPAAAVAVVLDAQAQTLAGPQLQVKV